MYLVKISGKEYGLPMRPREMKLRQYIDFTKEMEKVHFKGDDIYHNTIELAKCLAKFWGVDIEDLADANVTLDDFVTDNQDVKQFNDINGMCRIIQNVIGMYVPPENPTMDSFEYRGVKWLTPGFKASEFTEKYLRPVIRFGDVIKLNEAKRVAHKFIGKKDQFGRDKDANGDYQWTEMLFTVASLAKNEEMDSRFSSFEEKMAYFEDIDIETALNICFFLIHTYGQSKEIQDFISSLKPLQS